MQYKMLTDISVEEKETLAMTPWEEIEQQERRERMKSKMLRQNLTPEAKEHLRKGFEEFRKNPDEALRNAEDVTDLTAEELVQQMHEQAGIDDTVDLDAPLLDPDEQSFRLN